MSQIPEQIAVGVMASPVGSIALAASSRGLLAVLIGAYLIGRLEEVTRRAAGGPVETLAHEQAVTPWRVELTEYFAGQRREFTAPLDLRSTGFIRRAQEVIRNIPYGQTMTYSGVAAAAGSARRARCRFGQFP